MAEEEKAEPSPPPSSNQLDGELMKRGQELLQKLIVAQNTLGVAERRWHYAAVEFYKTESELASLDAEIRKKHDLADGESYDLPTALATGRIIKR